MPERTVPERTGLGTTDSGGPLLTDRSPGILRLTLHRPERRNSLDEPLLHALHRGLDEAERTPDCRIVVVEGREGVFCTGMDFEAASRSPADAAEGPGGELFLSLLERFTTLPRVVISKVDGRAAGGGVGLVAASDFVVATERSVFSLPEALWGLLPCCVLPFLIRRVGFQKAYAMTLGTLPVTAREGARCHLVDELSERPEEAIRKLAFRLTKVDPETVGDLKRYCRGLWRLSEETKRAALDELSRLMASPTVRRNVADFVAHDRFPWER